MAQLNFHPAPGLGDLAPGFFVVPQNPIRPDSTVLVPSVQASAMGQVVRKPHIGEFVAASFVVPQNPIIKNLQTHMGGLAGVGCGCGGGSTCGCGGGSYQGMSGFDVSSVTDWAQATSPVAGLPNWALWGGAAAAAWLIFMPGGSEYRGKKRALASEYRGYRRVARSVNPQKRRNLRQSGWTGEGSGGGFYRGGVFHPIRAADDYNVVRAGESRSSSAKALAKRARRRQR